MEMSFRKFMEMNVPGYHNDGASGAFVTSDQSGSEQHNNRLPFLPSYELTTIATPQDLQHGIIHNIQWHKKPHTTKVMLRIKTPTRMEDLALSTPEYNKMKEMNNGREPRNGDAITVLFQRIPGDNRPEWNGKPNTPKIMGILY
jgi:hypothetical protein